MANTCSPKTSRLVGLLEVACHGCCSTSWQVPFALILHSTKTIRLLCRLILFICLMDGWSRGFATRNDIIQGNQRALKTR